MDLQRYMLCKTPDIYVHKTLIVHIYMDRRTYTYTWIEHYMHMDRQTCTLYEFQQCFDNRVNEVHRHVLYL
jgi:hypothetical protein